MNTAVKPKEFYLERILAHEKADEVIRGTGWNEAKGKGCSIGCTLNSYNHKAYEAAGIGPEWLARVQDTLFEGMSADKAKTWTSAITLAIPDHLHGDTKNPAWDKIKAKFLIMVLKSTLENFDHVKFPKVKESVDAVIKLWEREDIGSPEFAARAARAAYAAYAADAAYAAYAADAARAAYAADAAYAAYAADAADAAYAAYAADAADAARAADAAYAAYAARAAAYAARAADAARAAKYDSFADGLLTILREHKK